VYRQADRTTVSVIEGAVMIDKAQSVLAVQAAPLARPHRRSSLRAKP